MARRRSRIANFWCHVWEGALASFGGELAGNNLFQVLVAALGGTAATLGTLQTIGSFAFLAPLVVAPFVEATARKKRLVMLLGLGQRAPRLLIAGALVLLATRRPLACLYVIGLIRLGGALATSVLVGPWQDLIAETVPIGRVGRLFGFRHFLSNVLTLPSALACAAILAHVAFPLSFELLYALSFGVMMISWVIFALVDEIPPAAAPKPRPPIVHYFRDLIAAVRTDRNYRRHLYHAAFNRAGLFAGGFLAFVAVETHGLSEARVVAVAGVLTGAAMIGGTLVLPFVAERVGPKAVLAGAAGVRAAAMLTAALAPSGTSFVAAFFLVGLARAARTVAGPPFMMRVFPRGRRVGYMALSRVALGPITVLTPITGGIAMARYGHGVVFAAAAAVALAALLPLAGITPRPESAVGPDATPGP